MRAIFVAILLVALTAGAQTPTPRPDIPLEPNQVTGTYPMKVQVPSGPEDGNVFQACCVRSDVDPVIELGCAAGTLGDLIEFEVTVVKTFGDNGEIRCYTEDSSDVSDYSENAYTLDFTRPGPPYVQ